MYFERQTAPNTCRLHALNNMVGRAVVGSWQEFAALCERYDNTCTALPAGHSSATRYFPTLQPTLLCWLMRELAAKRVLTTFVAKKPLAPGAELRRACALFLYSEHHVSVAKRVASRPPEEWVVLDSLRRGPVRVRSARHLAAWMARRHVVAVEFVHPEVMTYPGLKHVACVCEP